MPANHKREQLDDKSKSIADALRSMADQIEAGDPNTYRHFARISHGVEQTRLGAVEDILYTGHTLILSTLPLSREFVQHIENLYRVGPVR